MLALDPSELPEQDPGRPFSALVGGAGRQQKRDREQRRHRPLQEGSFQRLSLWETDHMRGL